MAKDEVVKKQKKEDQILPGITLGLHLPRPLTVTLRVFGSSSNTVKIMLVVSLKINCEGKQINKCVNKKF